MEEIIKAYEKLSAVQWYFEIKNLSLRNALNLRLPLSEESRKDLRNYYSQYFSSLLSATELFLESEYSERLSFEKSLYEKLVFGEHSDGEKNYSYLRELRNGIIHRGLDITSASHFEGNFPKIVATSPVTNRSGNISHTPFGFYLIDVINNCENVIGDIFLYHFEKSGIFQMRISSEKRREFLKKYLSDSPEVPDSAKLFALKYIEDIDFDNADVEFFESLVETLSTKIIT